MCVCVCFIIFSPHGHFHPKTSPISQLTESAQEAFLDEVGRAGADASAAVRVLDEREALFVQLARPADGHGSWREERESGAYLLCPRPSERRVLLQWK